MLAYLNEFHDYFKLYLPNTFLVTFIMFNHSLKRWHSSVGLTILSTCKWNYCNNYIRVGVDAARSRLSSATEVSLTAHAHPLPLLRHCCVCCVPSLFRWLTKFLVPCEKKILKSNFDTTSKLWRTYISFESLFVALQSTIYSVHSRPPRSRLACDATHRDRFCLVSCCENLALALWELNN